MTKLLISVADSASNTTFSPLGGVISATLAAASYSTPGSLDVWCAASKDTDPQTASTPSRFNPFQGIKCSIVSPNGTPDIFVGRIDTAEQIDDSGNGQRYWHIMARDWLSILADNPVQTGKWRSAGSAAGAWIPRLVPITPDKLWDGNYVGDYSSRASAVDPVGEQRCWMVQDLCLNILNDPATGLLAFSIPSSSVPNSKSIQRNFANLTQVSILDAIRDLARADPWNGAGLSARVDGYDIAKASFPSTAGFGAELQVVNPIVGGLAAQGRSVEYYRHGSVPTGFIYAYPPLVTSGAMSLITSYSFKREGADIFSRVRPTGQGDATYKRPDSNATPVPISGSGTGGTGILVQQMETGAWNPLSGQYQVRREIASYSNSLVGDWMYEDAGSEPEVSLARDMRDTAYADLFSGATALSNLRGGVNVGKIVIVGPPCDGNGFLTKVTKIIRPGETIEVTIPQMGILPANNNSTYIVQSWKYSWPDDTTIIDVSRVPYTSFSTQLIELQRRVSASISSHSKAAISQWKVCDPTGVITFHHALGTKPSNVSVEVAQWDGVRRAPDLVQPLPTINSHGEAPQATFDPVQGQNFGYMISRKTEADVTVHLGYWVAPIDGGSTWLKRDDPNTLVRIKVYP